MDEFVIFMVNEAGDPYQPPATLEGAHEMLREFPEDSIVIVHRDSFYARTYAAAMVA